MIRPKPINVKNAAVDEKIKLVIAQVLFTPSVNAFMAKKVTGIATRPLTKIISIAKYGFPENIDKAARAGKIPII